MKRRTLIAIAVMLVAAGCGDGGAAEIEAQAADYEAKIEAQAADYEAEIAQLEQQLSDATSTTTTTAPPAQTITGTMTLTSADGIRDSDGACWGRGGYDDMQEGADVVVRDGDGKIVGSSALEEGSDEGYAECVFAFEVDVPDDLDFYTVEISHRGGLTFTHAEMEATGWIVGFTLG